MALQQVDGNWVCCARRWAQDLMYEICGGHRECVEEVWRLCGGRYECVRAARATFEAQSAGALPGGAGAGAPLVVWGCQGLEGGLRLRWRRCCMPIGYHQGTAGFPAKLAASWLRCSLPTW